MEKETILELKKEVLLEARNVIQDIYEVGLTEKYIKELYRLLGNVNIPLKIVHFGLYTAIFNPELMFVSVDVEKLIEWIDNAVQDTKDLFNVKDTRLLKSYLTVYALCHEIEHSNQKLISDNKKHPNYDYKINAYHDVYDIFLTKGYLLPRPTSLILNTV